MFRAYCIAAILIEHESPSLVIAVVTIVLKDINAVVAA